MIQLLLYYFIWKIYLCFSTKNGEPREAALPIVSAHFLSLWLLLSIKIWVFFFVWYYGYGYLCWLFLHCGCHKTFVFLVQAAEININCRSFVSYTRIRLTALFPGLPGWACTRKVKPIWISRKQETVSGSGISWAICKSAPCSRQITTPVPHHSVCYRPDALPAAQPTASKHWRHKPFITKYSVKHVQTNK